MKSVLSKVDNIHTVYIQRWISDIFVNFSEIREMFIVVCPFSTIKLQFKQSNASWFLLIFLFAGRGCLQVSVISALRLLKTWSLVTFQAAGQKFCQIWLIYRAYIFVCLRADLRADYPIPWCFSDLIILRLKFIWTWNLFFCIHYGKVDE